MDLSNYRSPQYPLKSKEEWMEELYPDGKCIYPGMLEKRMERIFDTCYPIVCSELLQALVSFIGKRRALDVGAGTGYLARLLHDKGVSVRAFDSRNGPNTRTQWWERPLYFDVELENVLEMKEFDTDIVLMTWPCMNTSFSEHVAASLKPGQILLFQGEHKGGCVGTNEFFDLLYNRRKFVPLHYDPIEEFEITQVTWCDTWSIYMAR